MTVIWSSKIYFWSLWSIGHGPFLTENTGWQLCFFFRWGTGIKTLEPRDKGHLCVLLCCTCARYCAVLMFQDTSSVFKNLCFFFSLSWVIKWIIRMHDAGRPAERNLQLVTCLKQRAAWAQGEQRELRLDSSVVSSVCCRFKYSNNSQTPTRIVRKSAYGQPYSCLLDVTHPLHPCGKSRGMEINPALWLHWSAHILKGQSRIHSSVYNIKLLKILKAKTGSRLKSTLQIPNWNRCSWARTMIITAGLDDVLEN